MTATMTENVHTTKTVTHLYDDSPFENVFKSIDKLQKSVDELQAITVIQSEAWNHLLDNWVSLRVNEYSPNQSLSRLLSDVQWSFFNGSHQFPMDNYPCSPETRSYLEMAVKSKFTRAWNQKQKRKRRHRVLFWRK